MVDINEGVFVNRVPKGAAKLEKRLEDVEKKVEPPSTAEKQAKGA